MGWFVRITRFASVHMVYGQEKENSCGIACCMMVNFKQKKGLIARAAATSAIPVVGPMIAPTLTSAALKSAVAIEEEVYKVYGEVSGAPYDGSAYTWTDQLPKVLNKLGIGTWQEAWVGEGGVAGAVLDSLSRPNGYPIILLSNWNLGGGHFVVCDEVNTVLGTSYASICDPWNANVVVTSFKRGEVFKYTGKDPFGSWDLGGIKHSYETNNDGKLSGWVIRRTA